MVDVGENANLYAVSRAFGEDLGSLSLHFGYRLTAFAGQTAFLV